MFVGWVYVVVWVFWCRNCWFFVCWVVFCFVVVVIVVVVICLASWLFVVSLLLGVCFCGYWWCFGVRFVTIWTSFARSCRVAGGAAGASVRDLSAAAIVARRSAPVPVTPSPPQTPQQTQPTPHQPYAPTTQ